MSSTDLASSLKALRDTLRTPTALTPEDLSFHLSSTLQALGIHRTSLHPTHVSPEDLRAIGRYLPSVQGLLLTDIVPTFLPTLDDNSVKDLRTFFVPSRSPEAINTKRQIALSSYLSLPIYLNNPKPTQPVLPKQSREFLLSMLDSLHHYGIDDAYHAVFGSSAQSGEKNGAKDLQWQDAVRSLMGLPARVGNAVGRWNEGGAQVQLPERLLPKSYFDSLIIKLEGLMYELSQTPGTANNIEPLRLVFEKMASIGLVAQPTSDDSRSPSLFPALLPSILTHLHPPTSSPLPSYPPNFLPSIFLSLPSSPLASFVGSLLPHLTLRLIGPSAPLQPGVPDQRIRRAVEVFTQLVGPAHPGGEAWNAVLRSVLSLKGALTLRDHRQQAMNRVIVAWIAEAGESAVKAFIENVIEAWSDVKYVKFTLHAQQLNLTHILLLLLFSLPPHSSWLVSLSHRSKLIMAFQSYLSHPDPSVRRLGMLVAEILSELTIPESPAGGSGTKADDEIDELRKGLEVDEEGAEAPRTTPGAGGVQRLKFTGMWDGTGQGREECRWLRCAKGVRDGLAGLDDDPTGQAWLLGWDVKANEIATAATSVPLSPIHKDISRGRSGTPKKPASKSNRAPKPTKPKIVMLDPEQLDDPLEGYASSASSSRSPSPTPSYLEEVAADPSLALDAAQKKKVARPVYIPQLVGLLKERDKPESIEMALKWGEGLVRAKREFGTELAENAVGAALMTMGLNDSFHIEGFDENRQGLMNALAACSPKEVAPFLCEQYFNTQFSLQQKSIILTALAMGAREMAGLPVPQAQNLRRIDFPSKTLPPVLHRRYISEADVPSSRRITAGENANGQLEEAINGVRNLVLSKSAKKGDDVPQLARDRRLKVGTSKKTMVAELGTLSANQMTNDTRSPTQPVIPFKDIAAEYFIMPLMNRFWNHFNDSNIRESRALATGTRYRGAGTGMVLSPMALEKYLMTLAILLHAARHSPVFLSVLAPEALELAVTIGSRQPARAALGADSELDGEVAAEAQVVGSALEVCLVVLDTSFELDGGRSLALDKPALVLGVGEWATQLFQNESEGEMAAGQGGQGGRIRANAAGVVLKVGEIGEKWGHLGMRF